jgi:hypothetical protein
LFLKNNASRRVAMVHGVLILCLSVGPAAPLAIDDKADESPKPPPAGAVVLFDGKDLSGWITPRGKPAAWKVDNGYIEVAPGKGNIMTRERFGDFQLHVEFWIPLMASSKGQARGNSGVYLQGRYEIQVLDSYHNSTYADGACGALYKIIAPSTNACKPPEQWQTYDITFHAPRVDARGKVTEKGEITVVQNGITIIDRGRFDNTTAGEIDRKLGEPGPILLQDHGAKVRFRNLWLKPLEPR